MRKLNVDVEVLYGYDCMGRSHNSNKALSFEVSDDCANILNSEISKTDEDFIDKAAFEKLVELGNPELADLKDKIEDNCKVLNIQYWLDNCDDDGGAFVNSMSEDLENGTFVPSLSKDDFTKKYLDENKVPEDEVEDYEYEIEDAYYDLVYNEYESWVEDQGIYVQAEKHSLDTDVCGDMSDVMYNIYVE